MRTASDLPTHRDALFVENVGVRHPLRRTSRLYPLVLKAKVEKNQP